MEQNIVAELKAIREEHAKEFNGKLTELSNQIDTRWEEYKASPDAIIGETVKKMCDDRVKLSDEKAEKIEKDITDRLDEFETKMAKRGGGESPEALSLKAYDDFQPKMKAITAEHNGSPGRAKMSIPVKSVQIISRAGDITGDSALAPSRPGLYEYPQKPLSVRDVVLPGTIDGLYFKYERELAGSLEGDAGYQTEAAAKATMDIYSEVVTAEVVTIAVTSRTSTQVMDDRPAFFSFLRGRMAHLVDSKLDGLLLVGAGGSGAIEGINTIATAYDDGHVGNVEAAQQLDIIRWARNQVELSYYAPNVAILHPTDWTTIETIKDGDERYLIGDPKTGGSMGFGRIGSVWGMPVVSTASQTATEFTIGDGNASQLFMRQNLEVLASTEDQDNFVKNLVTLRAELRATLANYATTAWVTGDFATAIAAT